MLLKKCHLVAKKKNYFYLIDLHDYEVEDTKVKKIWYEYLNVDHDKLKVESELNVSNAYLVKLIEIEVDDFIYKAKKNNYFFINKLIDKNDWICDVEILENFKSDTFLNVRLILKNNFP